LAQSPYPSSTAFFTCFLGGLAYAFYLQATRPKQPMPEQGLVVPTKLVAGLAYVQPFESRILHSVMLAAMVLLCTRLYCRAKTTTDRS
jgi:hypothetical protein